MQFPQWVTCLPEGSKERRAAELRYAINLAATVVDRDGSTKALAKRLHCTEQIIMKSIRDGDFSKSLAARIEDLVGQVIIQKEILSTKYKK